MDNKGSCDFYPYRSFSNRNFFLFTLIFVNNPFLLKLELMFFVCCTHLNKVKKVSVIIRDSVWVPLIFFLELHLLYRLILWMFGMLLPQDSVSSQVFFFLSTFINSIQVLLPYMSSKHWTIDGSSDPRQTCCDLFHQTWSILAHFWMHNWSNVTLIGQQNCIWCDCIPATW